MGVEIPTRGGTILGLKGPPNDIPDMVDILKATRQGAARGTVRMPIGVY